jgi:hypothetical protein
MATLINTRAAMAVMKRDRGKGLLRNMKGF